MEVAAIAVVVATIDEPLGDSKGNRVSDNLLDLLPSLLADFASARVEVDLGDLADEVGQSRADAADGGQGEGDLTLAFEVGVQHSDDVLEFGGVLIDEALTLISLPSD